MTRVLTFVEKSLLRVPVLALGLLAGLVAFVKSGLDFTQVYIWPLDSWPDPAPVYPPLTYGFRLIAKLLGIESQTGYYVISLAVIGFVLLAIPMILARHQTAADGRWIVIVLMSGPMIWILAGGIGRTDPFIILAGVILGVLGRSLAWSLLAATLAILGNPEQAVVMSGCLLLVTAIPALRDRAKGALTALITALVAWLGLTLWSWSLGIPSRPDYFTTLWQQSLVTFFVQIPLELYAGFGIAAMVIVWALMDQHGIRLIAAVLGAVAIPVAITALTLDQSRVLVCCSSAAVVALVYSYGPSLRSRLASVLNFPLAVTFALALALPAIELAATKVRTPWEAVYPFVQAYLVSRLSGS